MATRKHSRSAKAAAKPKRGADVATALEEYLAAWRFRRAVEAGLRSLGLTFTQWLVLDATERAIVLNNDAVNQSHVARLSELDRMTVSQVMKTLTEKGLVDRGPSAEGPAYRIILTARGRRLQAEGRAVAAHALPALRLGGGATVG